MTPSDSSTGRIYRHAISLGYNCELAYTFWKTQKCVESSLFSWASATTDQLIHVLEDLHQLGSKGYSEANPAGGIFYDNATHIAFHSRMTSTIGATPKQIKECVAELHSRTKHLVEKFLRIAREEEGVLYLYKFKNIEDSQEKMKELVTSLYKKLEALHTHEFDLVVICEKCCPLAQVEIDNPHLFIRTVDFFPDDGEVTVGERDEEGWKRIFAEFPHQSNPLPKWFKTYQNVKPHAFWSDAPDRKRRRGLLGLFGRIVRHFERHKRKK